MNEFFAIFAFLYHQDYFTCYSWRILLILSLSFFFHLINSYRLSFCFCAVYFLFNCLIHLDENSMWLKDYLLQNWVSNRQMLLFLMSGVLTHLTMNWDEKFCFRWICFGTILLTLFRVFMGDDWFGVIENTSTNTNFIAVLFPYLSLWQMVIALGFFVFAPGRTAWAILLIHAVLFLYRSLSPLRVRLRLFYIGPIVVPLLLATYWKMFKRGFAYADRLDIWHLGISQWWKHDLFTGQGIGSWFVWIPRLQAKYQIQTGGSFATATFFTTAHNDYVQVLFETGLIGLILLLWVIVESLYRASSRSDQEFYTLLGMAIFAFFFFPLEMPALTVLWIFLIQRQLYNKEIPLANVAAGSDKNKEINYV